ncbi:MAG: hypothetical protein IT170_18460 [Bryobacterales bacterium]|nr:hypothetical protein [Bryobacterales bacterium]
MTKQKICGVGSVCDGNRQFLLECRREGLNPADGFMTALFFGFHPRPYALIGPESKCVL